MKKQRCGDYFSKYLWKYQESREQSGKDDSTFPCFVGQAEEEALKSEELLFAHGKKEPLFLWVTDYLINCDLRGIKMLGRRLARTSVIKEMAQLQPRRTS